MKRKMIVKKIGKQDGRVLYKATVRKGSEEEALAEILRVQYSSTAKQRFKICFEGDFSVEEVNDFYMAMIDQDNYRNTFTNNHNPRIITNIKLQIA